jgi:glycosyltransferase involved in cell wall biosynthesis
MKDHLEQTFPLRILMISTEYPPMKGGVGRYAYNLTKSMKKLGLEVYVACNVNGNGDYFGISPSNQNNSSVLLEIVDELHPDIVHIQYEHGLYGLSMDTLHPNKIRTNIEPFYDSCKTPIVTTFHSSYTFKQWMRRAKLMASASQLKGRQRSFKFLQEYWRHFLNYSSFHRLDRETFGKSRAGVVFSHYMAEMVGGGELIYHGAASPICSGNIVTKEEARAKFSLPKGDRIALALGFKTITKGWDIFEKMHIPKGWIIVINSSRNDYGIEKDTTGRVKNANIIDLQRGFLNDEDLSTLLYASDAVILPYTLGSSSGVMFDALAHSVPFIATNLEFFREFSTMGLGITVKRDPKQFSSALITLAKHYTGYTKAIDQFKENLLWENVAKKHVELYSRILSKNLATTPILTRGFKGIKN